jgi:hypothetical protein
MLRFIGLSLVSCLSSSALAQDARMPDDYESRYGKDDGAS